MDDQSEILIFKTPDVMAHLDDKMLTPEVREYLKQYIEYGEYLRVKFDPANLTLKILKVGEF